MIDYKGFHYDEYFVMLPDGKTIKTSRKECFKSCGKDADENQFKQRWYFSVDRHMAIRLPRNELGEKWYHWNAAELKVERRNYTNERSCVGRQASVNCSISCYNCKFNDECQLKDRKNNGRYCIHKCDICDYFTLRTVSISPLQCGSSGIGEVIKENLNSNNTEIVDIESDSDMEGESIKAETYRELKTELTAVLERLRGKDKQLCELLLKGKSKLQIAKEMNCTENAVRNRIKKLRTRFKNKNLVRFLKIL